VLCADIRRSTPCEEDSFRRGLVNGSKKLKFMVEVREAMLMSRGRLSEIEGT
jgi:hypothetical protein